MTVDDYMGGVTRRKTPLPPPPPETVAAFNEALGRALALARERVAANPRDADAHYEVGAAMGLRASYTATVESSALSAFKAAREAYDEHEKVLQIDTRRKDAGLIVGTYRYIVASLSMPLRWAAYMVGLRRRTRTGTEARRGRGRLRRRQPGGSALHAGRPLQPREAVTTRRWRTWRRCASDIRGTASPGSKPASTSLRAGKTADAERFLDEGMRLFATDTRPRMFGEDALWYAKRGTARASLGRSAEARADLEKALTLEAREWLHGRAHFELGKLDLKDGKRAAANEHLRTAIRLCENDNDETTAALAQRLVR